MTDAGAAATEFYCTARAGEDGDISIGGKTSFAPNIALAVVCICCPQPLFVPLTTSAAVGKNQSQNKETLEHGGEIK